MDHFKSIFQKRQVFNGSGFWMVGFRIPTVQVRVDVEFQNEVKTFIHIITENRYRRASSPVHALPSIPLHLLVSGFGMETSRVTFLTILIPLKISNVI